MTGQMMAMNPVQPVQQPQPLALPAPALPAPALPAPVPQPVPFPIIVHHNNQYQPAAIMNAGDSLERVEDRIDRMEKYRT